MTYRIIHTNLLANFISALGESPIEKLDNQKEIEIPVNYFSFYKSVSSVYSSKIEGEEIDFDSFFKHKFLNVKFKADYTQKADDLFAAYDFIENHKLTLENIKKAHSILSKHLLPRDQQGFIRTNPMFVINSNDQIEYVAADPKIVRTELDKLFDDIETLQDFELNDFEIFYFASLIHLVFVKIHPFQDGNGRVARLIEKWFLKEKIGDKAAGVQLEKNYYKNLSGYYSNIKKLGLEYEDLDYSLSLDFLLMTASGIENNE